MRRRGLEAEVCAISALAPAAGVERLAEQEAGAEAREGHLTRLQGGEVLALATVVDARRAPSALPAAE